MNARLVFQTLLQVAAATLITLLVGELAIRQLAPQTLSVWSVTPEGLIVHRAGAEVWSQTYERELRMNSMGMRDVEHTVDKPDGTYRVLLLGDSFTEAFQVDEADMLARRLERALAPRVGGEVEVINAGVSGWGTDHALHYVMQHGRELAPDLILYTLTLYTDVGDNLVMQFHHFEAGTLEEQPREAVSQTASLESKLKEWVSAHSQLARFVRSAIRMEDDAEAATELQSQFADLFLLDAPERLAFGRSFTGSLFEKADHVSRELGTTTAIAMIPMAMQLTDAEYANYLVANDLDPNETALDQPQSSMRAAIEERTRANVPIIDFLEPFRARTGDSSENLYSPMDAHWNEAGHALAAEVLAAELDARGLLPPADAR